MWRERGRVQNAGRNKDDCFIGQFVTHESIGYGDGCLFVMTGLFLGFWENLVLLLLASVLAGIGAAVLLFFRKKKKKERIPFVPFVFTAYVLLLL